MLTYNLILVRNCTNVISVTSPLNIRVVYIHIWDLIQVRNHISVTSAPNCFIRRVIWIDTCNLIQVWNLIIVISASNHLLKTSSNRHLQTHSDEKLMNMTSAPNYYTQYLSVHLESHSGAHHISVIFARN